MATSWSVGRSHIRPPTLRTHHKRAATATPAPALHTRRTWLYLARRSERQGAPVLIWPVDRPTARSAMNESSVSPERCEVITPHPAALLIFTAWIDSVRLPIWLTCAAAATRAGAAGASGKRLTGAGAGREGTRTSHPLDSLCLHHPAQRSATRHPPPTTSTGRYTHRYSHRQSRSRRRRQRRRHTAAPTRAARTLSSSALQALVSIAFCTRTGLVHSRSSPTTWHRPLAVNAV